MTLYLDTETTGLSAASGDTIVEIAIVDDRGVALINTLVNPQRSIPWQAANVHGIKDSMVQGMPTLKELLPEIKKIISGHQLVIYNASFDISFFPSRLKEALSIECAMKRFATDVGGGRKRKLNIAAEHVGHIWTGGAHRALADTLACRSVWRWLEGKAVQSKTVKPVNPVESLIIINCKGCQQKLRIPNKRLLDVTCPKCNITFRHFS